MNANLLEQMAAVWTLISTGAKGISGKKNRLYYIDCREKQMENKYSFSELVKTAYSFVLTKLTFPQARLIRRPIYIRGCKSIDGGCNLTTGRFCRFDLDGLKKTLTIGDNCEFGDFTHIVALNDVRIGNNVLIASKVFISDTNHGCYQGEHCSDPSEAPKNRELVKGTTIIGNNVWIGENAVILKGSKIGDGCVIGANSIISKEIPCNSIVIDANKVLRQYH